MKNKAFREKKIHNKMKYKKSKLINKYKGKKINKIKEKPIHSLHL